MNYSLRHLHDLLHVFDGDGVLLTVDIEADQLQLVARVCFLILCACFCGSRHAFAFEMAAICENSSSMSLAKSSTMIIAWPPTSLMRLESISVFTVVLIEPTSSIWLASTPTTLDTRSTTKPSGWPNIHHQRAGRVVMRQLGKAEQPAQRNDGQNLSPQVRQAL
jgi:hypothetical protein